jgi:hypothetical protein
VRYGALHLYYLHIQSLFPAAAMAIMMHSPATLTPTCKTETLGCSRGLFPGLWVVTWPVGRYRARDPWAIPGPGPCATQTTGCASERRCGPSLQARQGDSDGPPGCRRHPVWNGMYLSSAASWQCAWWDAPVAAAVLPGSAPPIQPMLPVSAFAAEQFGSGTGPGRLCTALHFGRPENKGGRDWKV